jgi:phage-related protein
VKEHRFINKQSLKEFKSLPEHIQRRFALDLNAISQGKDPFSKFKYPTDFVGIGAIELIENDRLAYRTGNLLKQTSASH